MEKLYDIWFSRLDISNKLKLELLNKYSTKEIWDFEFCDFLKNNIDEKNRLQIINSKSLEESKKDFEVMEEKNIKLICVKDEKYPSKLHNISDKPAFLYVRGNENILDDDSVRNSWM